MTPYGETALMAVCDGVGGLSSGEKASATVVHWFDEWFKERYPVLLSLCAGDSEDVFSEVQCQWEQGLYLLNDAIQNYGRDHDVQLGTTCTVILFYRGSYIIAQIGDSRVYRFSNEKMTVLTIDQTWVAQEVARGNIPPEKARTHPKRNIILQSVGTQKDLQPVFSHGIYEQGDAFMACSDGFCNELFDDELISAFGNLQHASEGEMYTNCTTAVDLVMHRGERDNITVAVVSCQEGENYESTRSVAVGEPTERFDDPEDPKTTILPQVEDDAQRLGA